MRISTLQFISLWVIFNIILMAVAFAHDKRYPVANKMHDWFMQLKSPHGVSCCADADGNIVMDADWETKDGHYRVRLGDKWQDVPDDAVIAEPNLYGPTMVWLGYSFGGNEPPPVRCFLPGSGS